MGETVDALDEPVVGELAGALADVGGMSIDPMYDRSSWTDDTSRENSFYHDEYVKI